MLGEVLDELGWSGEGGGGAVAGEGRGDEEGECEEEFHFDIRCIVATECQTENFLAFCTLACENKLEGAVLTTWFVVRVN